MTRAAAIAAALLMSLPVLAQAADAQRYVPEDNRPPLAFREDFLDQPTETPVTMASIKNKALRFSLYGPGAQGVAKSWHASPKDESGYIWTGACTQVCGFALKDPTSFLDMRELSKVTWRTKQTGFHQLRLMLKLADGTLLVSDQSVGASSDWRVTDMVIQDIKWRTVDAKVMNDAGVGRDAAAFVDKPDLSKVDEVGFTDLMPGSGHGTIGGSSRIDWIEVYARKVPR